METSSVKVEVEKPTIANPLRFSGLSISQQKYLAKTIDNSNLTDNFLPLSAFQFGPIERDGH